MDALLLQAQPYDGQAITVSNGYPPPCGMVPCSMTEYTVIGGAVYVYFSDIGFVSEPSDDPPNQPFDGVLLQPFNFEVRLFSGTEPTGQVTVGYGEVVLENGTGEYDDLLQYGWAGGTAFRLYRVDQDSPLVDAALVFDGVTDSLVAGENAIRFRLRDRQAIFDVPFQSVTYTGAGGAEGGDDLAGKRKPKAYGRIFNAPAVLVDAANLVYQVHDGEVQQVDAVRDKGVALVFDADYADYATLVAASFSPGEYATCLAEGLFRLNGDPTGQVTCDFRGDASGAGYVETTTDIVQRWATTLLGLNNLVYAGLRTVTFDFMDPGTLPDDATLTRGSIASYIDASGVLQTVSGDTGAWTYDHNGDLRGLNVEPARTNAAYPSGAIPNVGGDPWGLSNVTLATNDAVAPDGTTTASALTETTANNMHAMTMSNTNGPVFLVDTEVVYSMHVKLRSGSRNVSLAFADTTTFSQALERTVFSFSDGSVLGVTTTPPAARGSANAGSSWWRIWQACILEKSPASITGSANLGLDNDSDANNTVYVGDTGQSINVWGAQMEVVPPGEQVGPSSYIPTTSVAVTRNAVVLTLFPPAGTWNVEITRESGVTTIPGVVVTGAGYVVPTDLSPLQSVVFHNPNADTDGFDDESFTALALVQPAPIGFFEGPDSTLTVGQALSQVMAGIGGWWTMTLDGLLSVGRLEAPDGEDADDEISRSEMDDGTELQYLQAAPVWRVTTQYQRAWAVQSADGLAGAVTAADRLLYSTAVRTKAANDPAVQARNRAARDLAVTTYFAEAADAQDEADRLLALYGAERGTFSQQVERDPFTIPSGRLGGVVSFTDWDRLGWGSSRQFRHIGMSSDWQTGTTTWVFWG